jgi:hypothetical protein
MRIMIIVLGIVCLLANTATAALMMRERSMSDNVPDPVLLSPVQESVDLTGKASLEFRWSPHERARGFRRFYDFRLYEGTNEVESTRIYKEEVPPEQHNKSLPTKMFDNGKVYTWTLRQVYDEGRKSRRSYNTFKVVK